MAEKSRVLQLEEELSLRREEIEELQQCLLHSGPPPADHPEAAETLRLRERLLSASKERQRESGLLRDKYEKALRAYQAEVDKLREERCGHRSLRPRHSERSEESVLPRPLMPDAW